MKWDSDLATWITTLSLYKPAIDHRDSHNNKSGIATLDSYIWETLTPLVRSRTPPFIHASEYSKVVQWKLKRGRWRPRLQAFADDTTQHEVVDASRQAYVALQTADIKQALAPLIFLKGCGPATASAILALADDSVPFMSDELLLAAQGEGKRQYTVNAYMQLAEKVREKAQQLTQQSTNFTWTARDVEHAVFASQFAETAPAQLAISTNSVIPRPNATASEDAKSVPKSSANLNSAHREDTNQSVSSNLLQQPNRENVQTQRVNTEQLVPARRTRSSTRQQLASSKQTDMPIDTTTLQKTMTRSYTRRKAADTPPPASSVAAKRRKNAPAGLNGISKRGRRETDSTIVESTAEVALRRSKRRR